ncbi:deoxyribonuclease V [Melghirimyces algeriensis]|uniref:Endonuclease V n=1 Tax=Melghirimyces algeriensis TaxID=910412 RepID=A0A521BYY8_9BACL|nr:deoxyribonuclease V [Melghirimyces algeriensis]SMO52397.1 Endonuclease V [Melghirimyces algeriensis]
MEPVIVHPWNVQEEEALAMQHQLASQVIQTDQMDTVQMVAGVDVAYHPRLDKQFAAVVILDAESLDVVESVVAEDTASFPYIPGLFSFREIPPIIKAFKQLKTTPDLLVCDGQGMAHPRRFGLASHLGVLYDLPTIGCGKTRFIGDAKEPDDPRGAFTPLIDQGEVVGHVLRTQNHTKPVYVSIGHRISLFTACDWVLKLSPRYRLPETTRQADQRVRKALTASLQ